MSQQPEPNDTVIDLSDGAKQDFLQTSAKYHLMQCSEAIRHMKLALATKAVIFGLFSHINSVITGDGHIVAFDLSPQKEQPKPNVNAG